MPCGSTGLENWSTNKKVGLIGIVQYGRPIYPFDHVQWLAQVLPNVNRSAVLSYPVDRPKRLIWNNKTNR